MTVPKTQGHPDDTGRHLRTPPEPSPSLHSSSRVVTRPSWECSPDEQSDIPSSERAQSLSQTGEVETTKPSAPPAESPAAQDPLGAGRSPGWMANAGSKCVRAGWGQRGREGPGSRGINPALPLVAVTDGTNQDDPMDLRGSLPADASRSTGIPPAGASDSTVPHGAQLSLSSLIFRHF